MSTPETDTEKLSKLLVQEHGEDAKRAALRYALMFRINEDWDNMTLWNTVIMNLANRGGSQS